MSTMMFPFGPRAPEQFTVLAGAQVQVAHRQYNEGAVGILYISNNSSTIPVYLGFTPSDTTEGNAAVKYGITVFPGTTMAFTSTATPWGCNIWATCESESAVIGVQQG